MMKILVLCVFALFAAVSAQCPASWTTAVGTYARPGPYCPGELIFEDNFDFFDLRKWGHENTLAGGGNWEFQWYGNNRSNSYTNNGVLHLAPTLLADTHGEDFMAHGVLNIHGGSPADECTNPQFYGCERTASPDNLLNPIRAARIRSIESFSFKYGTVEINAKLPEGDWLWPALWMLPRDNAYGTWPLSGEIDIMESRGNVNLMENGVNIGAEHVGSTLHFGPFWPMNGWPTATFSKNSAPGNGYHLHFHRYGMQWTPDQIRFTIDDVETGTVVAGAGFWERGGFARDAPGIINPWRYGTHMAPFDQEFYFIFNLAVGGISYFPDNVQNPGGKPWNNNSGSASTDFWRGRGQWLPGWNLGRSDTADLQIDYIRVWAI